MIQTWTKSHWLTDLATGRANNLNLLRFFAASLVILSHSYAIAGDPGHDPISIHFGALETGGTLGVLIFFSISGYLIAQSFAARNQMIPFLRARVLRIYPGLITATFYSALLASFGSTVPAARFWPDPLTRDFLVHNSLGYPTKYLLPGAFTNNPVPGAANGSLWTLPIEMQMYLVVAALGILGLLGRRKLFNILFAIFAVVAIVYRPAETLLVYGVISDAGRMAMIFLIGTFFFLNRDRVPISIPAAVLLVAATTALHKLPNTHFYYIPVVAYVVFVLAYHPKLYFAAFNRLGDYSYGLYIYAFPTQQLIAYAHRDIKALPLFYFAFPCVLAMAVLSWTFIEKPMLRLKSRGSALPAHSGTQAPIHAPEPLRAFPNPPQV